MISITKNIFTAVCLAISLVLLVQLLIVFVEEKPTTTTKLDDELDMVDIPDLVVCMEPGFDNVTSKKYGYDDRTYWMGVSNKCEFVGWNGKDGYLNKSSRDILEETLIFPESQDVLFNAGYSDMLNDFRYLLSSATIQMDLNFVSIIFIKFGRGWLLPRLTAANGNRWGTVRSC